MTETAIKKKEREDNELIAKITKHTETVFDALGITSLTKQKLRETIFDKYSDSEKYKLSKILDDIIGTGVATSKEIFKETYGRLVEADKQLKKMSVDNKFEYKKFNKEWSALLENLGELQGLIFIKKAEKGCDELIEEILRALNAKLTAVNSFLNSDLE